MQTNKKIKIGLFGIGLDTYWTQFEGLFARLQIYQNQIGSQIKSYGVELINCGMVDNPLKAKTAADTLKQNNVELVFLYISTYALSSTVIPVLQKLNVTTIILNLQSAPAIDYKSINNMRDRALISKSTKYQLFRSLLNINN